MVIWHPAALLEEQSLVAFVSRVNLVAALNLDQEFFDRADYYEQNPSAASAVPGLSRSYKLGYVHDSDYKMWFKILAPGDIAILMLRSSRQRPPTLSEIRTRG